MAKLTFEIELTKIKKFAALAEIELTSEQEAQLVNSEILILAKEAKEVLDSEDTLLAFAGIIITKYLENTTNTTP